MPVFNHLSTKNSSKIPPRICSTDTSYNQFRILFVIYYFRHFFPGFFQKLIQTYFRDSCRYLSSYCFEDVLRNASSNSFREFRRDMPGISSAISPKIQSGVLPPGNLPSVSLEISPRLSSGLNNFFNHFSRGFLNKFNDRYVEFLKKYHQGIMLGFLIGFFQNPASLNR